MDIIDTTLRGRLTALNLPGGVAVNAEGLIREYGYPFDSAVERAMEWHDFSQRVTALGY